MTKKELKNYYLNLSLEEKNNLLKRIETTMKELWNEGFSLGMIEYFGDSISTRAKNEIKNKQV